MGTARFEARQGFPGRLAWVRRVAFGLGRLGPRLALLQAGIRESRPEAAGMLRSTLFIPTGPRRVCQPARVQGILMHKAP